jgi:gluconokinase
MVIVIGGVAGAGKSTIAQALARRLQFAFFEGDEFHTPESLEKMQSGVPLNDADREPWLLALCDLIGDLLASGADGVLTCSALRESYREMLSRDGVQFVLLWVPFEVACLRLQKRTGHFFQPALLASQFATFEEPEDAFTIDANRPIEDVVEDIVRLLRLGAPQ